MTVLTNYQSFLLVIILNTHNHHHLLMLFFIVIYFIHIFWQGGSGRFDLTVGPKQTMGKLVSGISWVILVERSTSFVWSKQALQHVKSKW